MSNPRSETKSSRNSTKMVVLVIVVVVALIAIIGGGGLLASKADDNSEVSSTSSESLTAESTAPDPATAEGREWTGTLAFNGKDLGVTLFGDKAPKAVASFLHLSQTGFFDGTKCHRLTTGGFDILQCGDPTGTGTGGPGYSFGPVENAPADELYKRGVLAMARTNDPNSNGSQFFLVYGDTTIPAGTAGGYTVFGEITSGLDAVTDVAAQGVVGGQQDGPPVAPAVLGMATFK